LYALNTCFFSLSVRAEAESLTVAIRVDLAIVFHKERQN